MQEYAINKVTQSDTKLHKVTQSYVTDIRVSATVSNIPI